MAAKELHTASKNAKEPDLLLKQFPDIFKLEGSTIGIECNCGFKKWMELPNYNKMTVKALKQILVRELFHHARLNPFFYPNLVLKNKYDSLPNVEQSLGSYNKCFELTTAEELMMAKCRLCPWEAAFPCFELNSTKALARLMVTAAFLEHVQEAHLTPSFQFVVLSSKALSPSAEYLYIDFELARHSDSPDNTVLVFMASFKNGKFGQVQSLQARTGLAPTPLFSTAGVTFEVASLYELRRKVQQMAQAYGNMLLVKDGRLQLTILSLLKIKGLLFFTDLGGGLNSEIDPVLLPQFKGNHLNAKSELQFYQQQLERMQLKYQPQLTLVEPKSFKNSWCNLSLRKRDMSVQVATSVIWKLDPCEVK